MVIFIFFFAIWYRWTTGIMVIYLNRKSFLAFLWKWSWQPIKHQPGLEPQTTSERPSCNLHAYLGTSILIVLFEKESAFWLHVHVLMFPLCDKRFHKKMHQIKNGHGAFIKLVDCGGNFLNNNRENLIYCSESPWLQF